MLLSKMKSKYEIKKWIVRVINSSLTWNQIATSQKLVDNFKKQMLNEGYDEMLMMPYIVELNLRIENKRRDLIEKKNVLTHN